MSQKAKTAIRIILAVIVFLIFFNVWKKLDRYRTYPLNPRVQTPENITNSEKGLNIIGDTSCQEQTSSAINLLKNKSPRDYQKVLKHLGTIECINSGSVVYPWQNPPLFRVGRETSNAGIFWYASVLVHETCHIELYSKGLAWKGEGPEKTCLEIQYDALVKIGANKDLLDYARNIINSEWWKQAPENSWY